ncbi:hypothetical protein D1BOALGB6SA_5726 [Olavius sp. associated proteobacterium Delta 1]|nr:hypothetical protein D1BOALGB6SA_5726 [Olavius sp. associated proteobacterium Delta 1]
MNTKSNKNKYKVSIVTPNYNYENYIGKTIESILKQSYKNIEHIIVDDGSTDNSVDIINSYISEYPDRIKLITQKNNGQSNALNKALKRVTGDIIGWINSDDTFCNDSISKIIDAFSKNKTVDIIFGDMNVVDLDGNYIYKRRHLKFSFIQSCFVGFYTTLSSNTIFWKKKAMDENGYLDENLHYNMDGEFFSRLTRNMKVLHINDSIANFRKQPHTKASEKFDNWNEIVRKELMYELRNSYNNLPISKIIPFEGSFLIRKTIWIWRVLKRLIHLHYFLQRYEIFRYKNRENSNNKIILILYFFSLLSKII